MTCLADISETVRDLLTDQRVSFHGSHVDFDDVVDAATRVTPARHRVTWCSIDVEVAARGLERIRPTVEAALQKPYLAHQPGGKFNTPADAGADHVVL